MERGIINIYHMGYVVFIHLITKPDRTNITEWVLTDRVRLHSAESAEKGSGNERVERTK